MPLIRTKKEQIVNELADKLSRASLVVFVDPTGLSAGETNELRRLLKGEFSGYKMYKKTLMKLAFDTVGIDKAWLEKFGGAVACAFSYDPDVNIAKPIYEFAKKNEKLQIVAGLLDRGYLEQAGVITLAKLPSKDVLRAQVAGALISPIRGLIMVLSGNLRNLVIALSQIRK